MTRSIGAFDLITAGLPWLQKGGGQAFLFLPYVFLKPEGIKLALPQPGGVKNEDHKKEAAINDAII